MADPINVEPMDSSKENSPIAGPVDDQATVIMNKAADVCVWNGQSYPDGTTVSAQGVNYECSLGQWGQAKLAPTLVSSSLLRCHFQPILWNLADVKTRRCVSSIVTQLGTLFAAAFERNRTSSPK